MSDTKNVVFRSAVGGYNKNDVNEYLVRMSSELIEREDAAAERVKRAEREAAESIARLAELEAKLTAAEAMIKEKESEISDLIAEKTELEKISDEPIQNEYEEKISEQEAVIAKQFEEIDTLRAENEALKAKLSEASVNKDDYDELVKKAALYDKTSANIGEAIISANKTAEEILSAARAEAKLLTDRAEKELAEKRRALEESSKRALDSIFGKLTLAASESRKDISAASAYSYQVLEKAIEDIKLKTGNSEAKLKSYEESIWRSIKDDLDGIDNSSEKKPSQKKMTPEQMRRLKRQ